MPFKFNPFSGNFDQTGSGGGGASYLDGEVEFFSDLPLSAATAPLDSAWLVRKPEGAWFLTKKHAGLYIRTATGGTDRNADYTYAGAGWPDVFSDANFTLYDESDSTKNAKFQLSSIATGTTRTITVPNKNITLDDAGDSRAPTAHAASHNLDGSDGIVVEGLATATSTQYHALVSNGQVGSGSYYGVTMSPAVLAAGALYTSDDLGSQNVKLACDATGTWTVANSDNFRTAIELGDAATADIGTGSTEVAAGNHGHGNITSDGKLGTTAGLPVVTTTAGAVTTLALGTANQVLRVNSGATGVEFADPSGGGASINQAIAVGFVLN